MHPELGEVLQSAQCYAASRYGGIVGPERREAARNGVRIHVVGHTQGVTKEGWRRGALACTVGATNDHEVGTRHALDFAFD